eukprot:67501-Chlamydomonas_euryale.AAC.7
MWDRRASGPPGLTADGPQRRCRANAAVRTKGNAAATCSTGSAAARREPAHLLWERMPQAS